MDRLISAGTDINAVNSRGDTALILACSWRSGKIVEKLIQAGADINVKNNNGFTAAMIADERGNVNIINRLQKATRAQQHIHAIEHELLDEDAEQEQNKNDSDIGLHCSIM